MVAHVTDKHVGESSVGVVELGVLAGRVIAEGLVFLAQALPLVGVASLIGFRVHSGLPGMVAMVLDAVGFGVAAGIAASRLALRIRDPETAQRALFLPMVPLAVRLMAWLAVLTVVPGLLAVRRWQARS